jgi:hypothetical protein
METDASAKPNKEVPSKVLIILLESILAGEDTRYASFKHFCDIKKDDQGNHIFGEAGSGLRRGKYFVWPLPPFLVSLGNSPYFIFYSSCSKKAS